MRYLLFLLLFPVVAFGQSTDIREGLDSYAGTKAMGLYPATPDYVIAGDSVYFSSFNIEGDGSATTTLILAFENLSAILGEQNVTITNASLELAASLFGTGGAGTADIYQLVESSVPSAFGTVDIVEPTTSHTNAPGRMITYANLLVGDDTVENIDWDTSVFSVGSTYINYLGTIDIQLVDTVYAITDFEIEVANDRVIFIVVSNLPESSTGLKGKIHGKAASTASYRPTLSYLNSSFHPTINNTHTVIGSFVNSASLIIEVTSTSNDLSTLDDDYLFFVNRGSEQSQIATSSITEITSAINGFNIYDLEFALDADYQDQALFWYEYDKDKNTYSSIYLAELGSGGSSSGGFGDSDRQVVADIRTGQQVENPTQALEVWEIRAGDIDTDGTMGGAVLSVTVTVVPEITIVQNILNGVPSTQAVWGTGDAITSAERDTAVAWTGYANTSWNPTTTGAKAYLANTNPNAFNPVTHSLNSPGLSDSGISFGTEAELGSQKLVLRGIWEATRPTGVYNVKVFHLVDGVTHEYELGQVIHEATLVTNLSDSDSSKLIAATSKVIRVDSWIALSTLLQSDNDEMGSAANIHIPSGEVAVTAEEWEDVLGGTGRDLYLHFYNPFTSQPAVQIKIATAGIDGEAIDSLEDIITAVPALAGSIQQTSPEWFE